MDLKRGKLLDDLLNSPLDEVLAHLAFTKNINSITSLTKDNQIRIIPAYVTWRCEQYQINIFTDEILIYRNSKIGNVAVFIEGYDNLPEFYQFLKDIFPTEVRDFNLTQLSI